jgi:hypothetical protein
LTDDLPPSFRRALDVMRTELTERPELVGILFFGSAARGEAGRGSDLDLYAITSQDARGHLGRLIDDVPVEVSFGSVAQMTAQIRNEQTTVVHAFATGRLLLDRTDGALEALCREARELWTRGPGPVTPSAILRFRFHLTDLVRDLEAMPERPAATALVGSECVRLALEALCATDQRWMPSTRKVLDTLGDEYREVIRIVRQCADSGFPASLAVQAADWVLCRIGGRLESYDTSGTS